MAKQTDSDTTLDAAPAISTAEVKAALTEALGEKSKAVKLLESLDETEIDAELAKIAKKLAALTNAVESLKGLKRMATILTHGRPPRKKPVRKNKPPVDDDDATSSPGAGAAQQAGPMVERVAAYLRASGPSSPAAIAEGVRSSAAYVSQVLAANEGRFRNVGAGRWEIKR